MSDPNALATALEALGAKATPGPWKAFDNHITMPKRGAVEFFTDNPFEGDSCNDTHLVVFLRNHLPELLAALRASRGPQEQEKVCRHVKTGDHSVTNQRGEVCCIYHNNQCNYPNCLEARGPQEATAQAWQPIASFVPANGTKVLVVHRYGDAAEYQLVIVGYWCDERVEFEDAEGFKLNATHWQPLPAPPVAASGAEGAE